MRAFNKKKKIFMFIYVNHSDIYVNQMCILRARIFVNVIQSTMETTRTQVFAVLFKNPYILSKSNFKIIF